MRKFFCKNAACILVLVLCCGIQVASADDADEIQTARQQAVADGWPDTPAGLMGSGWVTAFNEGTEPMQEFLLANLTEASLAKRPMAPRMSSYKSLSKKYGSLMLTGVVKSKPSELTATIMAEDTSSHTFVFRVEEKAPHNLEMVGIVQMGHGHGK